MMAAMEQAPGPRARYIQAFAAGDKAAAAGEPFESNPHDRTIAPISAGAWSLGWTRRHGQDRPEQRPSAASPEPASPRVRVRVEPSPKT